MVKQEIIFDRTPSHDSRSFVLSGSQRSDDPFELVDVRDPLIDIEDAFRSWERDFEKSLWKFFELLNQLQNNGVDITFRVGRYNNFSGGKMTIANMALVLLAMTNRDIKLSFRTEYEQNQCISWFMSQLMSCLENTPEWWKNFYKMDLRPYMNNENNEAYRAIAIVAALCVHAEGVVDPMKEHEQRTEAYRNTVESFYQKLRKEYA